jgi:hypothetical protein
LQSYLCDHLGFGQVGSQSPDLFRFQMLRHVLVRLKHLDLRRLSAKAGANTSYVQLD